MTGSGKWRCTDIGTRVIVAICLEDYPDDPVGTTARPMLCQSIALTR